MTRYPILARTLTVVIPTCTLVPIGGLLLGIVVALLLTMVVTS